MKKMLAFGGVLLMINAAFAFVTVYETVKTSFAFDEFRFAGVNRVFSPVTPTGLLQMVLTIAMVVLIARFSVFMVKWMGDVGVWWFEFLMSMALFSCAFLTLEPIVRFFAKGEYLTVILNSVEFGRPEFMGFVLASPIIIGAEYLRRFAFVIRTKPNADAPAVMTAPSLNTVFVGSRPKEDPEVEELLTRDGMF